MSLRINQNIDALNSYRNLSVTQGQMSKSLEKLSSGFRINRAADDAAGLAISEGLRSQVGGIKVAVRNTQDGISMVQTAEGALTETHSILQRMRDLAVQSTNASNDQSAREAINAETSQLKDELNRISEKTTFNNINLLDGSFKDKDFQVGYAANDTISVSADSGADARAATDAVAAEWVSGTNTVASLKDTTITVNDVSVDTSSLTDDASLETAISDALGSGSDYTVAVSSGVVTITAGTAGAAGNVTVTGLTQDTDASTAGADAKTAVKAGSFGAGGLGVDDIDLTSVDGSQSAIEDIDAAIKTVSSARANLGAVQNRFEHTINNLSVTQENLTASESRIRDTDMASEMMNFTRSQILSQAGTAMLAQANQAPQGVLSLLR